MTSRIHRKAGTAFHTVSLAIGLALATASANALAAFGCYISSASFCQDNNLDSSNASTVCGSSGTIVSSCDVVSAGKSVTGSCTVDTLLKQTYYGPQWTLAMAQQTCGGIGGVFSAGTGSQLPPPVIGNPSTPMAPPVADQTTYKVPVGALPTSSVAVTATGTLGSGTVSATVDLSKVLAGNQLAAGYNVYVVALVPGQQVGSATDVWYQNGRTTNWKPLAFPLAAFMENVAAGSADQRLVINIVSNTDLTALIGAEIYLGYGLSDTEMLAAKRYRGIYKVKQ